MDNGARDACTGYGYHPHERAFQETPGYNPQLGPFGLYQRVFREAYVRARGVRARL